MLLASSSSPAVAAERRGGRTTEAQQQQRRRCRSSSARPPTRAVVVVAFVSSLPRPDRDESRSIYSRDGLSLLALAVPGLAAATAALTLPNSVSNAPSDSSLSTCDGGGGDGNNNGGASGGGGGGSGGSSGEGWGDVGPAKGAVAGQGGEEENDERRESSSSTSSSSSPPPSSLTFDVSGMHCGGCVSAVTKLLEAHSGVRRASVNLATEVARVELAEAGEEEGDEASSRGHRPPPSKRAAAASQGDSAAAAVALALASLLADAGFPSTLRFDKKKNDSAGREEAGSISSSSSSGSSITNFTLFLLFFVND